MDKTLSLHNIELLAGVDLFQGLDRVSLSQLAFHVELVPYEDGEAVFHRGDKGDALYVVSQGLFQVLLPPENGRSEVLLNNLSPGDYFGEQSILTSEPRSAAVRAKGPAEALRLPQSEFLELIRRRPAIATAVIGTLVRRVTKLDQTVARGDQLIAQVVERNLEQLEPERRARLLQASILDDTSVPTLQVLFEKDAEAIAQDLASLDAADGRPRGLVLGALRRQFELESGSERMQRFARQSGWTLAGAQRWDAALSVLARYGQRRDFAAVLSRALQGALPLTPDRVLYWIEHLTDDECLEDTELALARASMYQGQGSTTAGAVLLRRALEAAVLGHDAESSRRLTEALSRQVVGNSVAPTPDSRSRASVGLLRLPLSWRAWLTGGLTAALILPAAVLGHREPLLAFALLLAAAVILWVRRVTAEFVVGLGLLCSWLLFGIAKPQQALAGFGSTTWLFVLAILGISTAIARSGLMFRASLMLIRRMPQALFGQAGTLMLTGVILTPVLPQNQSRAAVTSPIALAVARAQQLKDNAPGAAVLGLASWIGASPLMFMFVNGSTTCLLAWGLMPAADKEHFDWIHWFLAALPLGLIIGFGSLIALFLMFRPAPSTVLPRDRIDLQLAVLGPLSRRELAMLVVLVFTVIGWVMSRQLHVDQATVALLGLIGAVITGNFDQRSLKELDWNFLLYYGVALSITAMATALKLDRVSAQAVAVVVTHVKITPITLILVTAIISVFVESFLSKQQGVLLLSLALIPVAQSLHVNPFIVAITVLTTASLWFIPSQTSSYLVAYAASEGRLFSHAQARGVCVAYTAITFAGLLLSIPYWHWLGLL